VKSYIKDQYKTIDKKYPYLGHLIRRIYFRKLFNKVEKKLKGRGNRVDYKSSILTNVKFDIKGDENKIIIEDGCILDNVTFHIRGNSHSIQINKGVHFNRGGSVWFEDNNCSLSIERFSTFENVHIALTEPNSKILIGEDCMFAYDIDLRTGDSHSIFSQENNERINYAQDIIIGNHVWIAAHSILLKGTIISDNSVVATGSVVTRKFFEEGIVLGGNPATQIKNKINWSRERIYKEN